MMKSGLGWDQNGQENAIGPVQAVRGNIAALMPLRTFGWTRRRLVGQLKLDILGRPLCGFNETEGMGDCGPVSILQSLNLRTKPLMHAQCPFSGTIRSSQAQADQGCAELRSVICAAIRDHADVQHIANIIFPDQPSQDLIGLGTCVALYRRRRLNQSSNGIWLNALGLRACARHLNRDILVLGGPTGDISLFPCEPALMTWAMRTTPTEPDRRGKTVI